MLVYVDTIFSGLLKGKLLQQGKESSVVRLTVKHGTYRKGEILTEANSRIIPRNAVRVRQGKYRILGDLTSE